MGGTATRRRGAWWFWCVVLATGLQGQALAGPNDLTSPTSRIRPTDKKAASLLQAGNARSATFRRLAELIEQSDLVLYVETGRLPLRSKLQFVCASPNARYVRVSVRVPGLDNDLVPWLAHELWHAIEIAGAPDVRDEASLQQFYERLNRGFRTDGTVQIETIEAQETQNIVLAELRQPSAAARKRQLQ